MARRPAFWLIFVCTVGLGVAVSYRPLGSGPLALYVIAGLIPFLDAVDLAMRLYLRRLQAVQRDADGRGSSIPLDVGAFSPFEMTLHMRPYAIVASVYNAEGQLDTFLETIGPYRERVWVIDDGSTDDTSRYLERAGVRCVRSEVNRKKPGAIRALLRELPEQIETIVVVDPDVRFLDRKKGGLSDLERVVFEFQRSRHAAVCPRLVTSGDVLLSRLQRIEYTLSFSIGRKSLAGHSITSGISVYRRENLEAVLDQHSLSVYAEDLENTVILLSQGESVYYDDRLTIATDGPEQWTGWFSQRVGWAFGLLKVYFEHALDLRRVERRGLVLYHYLVYIGVFSLLLHPLKIVALVLIVSSFAASLLSTLGLDAVAGALPGEPNAFLLAYLHYTAFTILALGVSDRSEERWNLLPTVPLYFFYVLAHLVPVTVGYANWVSMRWLRRRIYRDHYQDESSLRGDLERLARMRGSGRVRP